MKIDIYTFTVDLVMRWIVVESFYNGLIDVPIFVSSFIVLLTPWKIPLLLSRIFSFLRDSKSMKLYFEVFSLTENTQIVTKIKKLTLCSQITESSKTSLLFGTVLSRVPS
jgi:hypothetical protein